MVRQRLVHLPGMPARVPELQYPAPIARQQDEEITQPLEVDLLVRGQLKQNWPEFGTQVVRPFQAQRRLTFDLAKPFYMRDIPACLDCRVEPVGGDIAPPLEHLYS